MCQTKGTQTQNLLNVMCVGVYVCGVCLEGKRKLTILKCLINIKLI